jgi:hypothetical protein
MIKAKLTPKRKWPMPLRILFARPRLLVSILVGVSALPMYSDEFRGVTRILVGWTSALRSISASRFG